VFVVKLCHNISDHYSVMASILANLLPVFQYITKISEVVY